LTEKKKIHAEGRRGGGGGGGAFTEAMEQWKWGMAAKNYPFPNCN